MSRSQAPSGTPVEATPPASDEAAWQPSSLSLEVALFVAGCNALARNGEEARGEAPEAPPPHEGEPWPGRRNIVGNSGVLSLLAFPLAVGEDVGRSTSR